MLELRNITKVYNPGTVHENVLFRDFSFGVEEGSFVSVVGSNGSGKTSLLNILCGSIPVEGRACANTAAMHAWAACIRTRPRAPAPP